MVGKLLPPCNGIPEQATGYRDISAVVGVHYTESVMKKLRIPFMFAQRTYL
jgi:hypothetical protein